MISILPLLIAALLVNSAQETEPAKASVKGVTEVPSKAAPIKEGPGQEMVAAPKAPAFVPPAETPDAVEGGVLTRFFHDDGTVAREGYLKDGARVGVWKSWFLNGQLALHGAYQGYARVGSWVLNSEDGKSITHAVYDLSLIHI